MPVHTGVMCERCRKVFFAATWRGISPSRKDAEAFEFACKPPCRAVQEFRVADLRPYRVSDEVFQRGYAEENDYEVVEGRRKETTEQPKRR